LAVTSSGDMRLGTLTRMLVPRIMITMRMADPVGQHLYSYLFWSTKSHRKIIYTYSMDYWSPDWKTTSVSGQIINAVDIMTMSTNTSEFPKG
jgi:hypothetical protein